MVNFLLLLLFWANVFVVFSQEKNVINKGLLRAQANIAGGKMTSYNQGSIYIYGDLEYYLDSKTSIKGEGFYFVNATNKNADKKLILNHSIFSGAIFHIPSKWNLDPYFAILPGLALTQLQHSLYDANVNTFHSYKSNVDVSPLIAPLVGIQYFAPKFFHVFTNIRYVHGVHLGNSERYKLNELRVTFGLGFNISLIKS